MLIDLKKYKKESDIVDWLIQDLLIDNINVKLITLSRLRKAIKIQKEKITTKEVNDFEINEAISFLEEHDIKDERQSKFLITISRLHPLSLSLSVRATLNTDLRNKVNLASWKKLSQELVVEFLVKEILDNETNELYKKALQIYPY